MVEGDYSTNNSLNKELFQLLAGIFETSYVIVNKIIKLFYLVTAEVIMGLPEFTVNRNSF